eukprot:TRINITY_DN15255_c0_g1_i1.p1 TRINITY_DN15255_c0_g1~~TRINITY_DN15255_c0_g1_i1.p1  ORF type:complete len:650 (-),score=126.14 TRINITY_DN15255_c0_g1_i1:130-1926(-)
MEKKWLQPAVTLEVSGTSARNRLELADSFEAAMANLDLLHREVLLELRVSHEAQEAEVRARLAAVCGHFVGELQASDLDEACPGPFISASPDRGQDELSQVAGERAAAVEMEVAVRATREEAEEASEALVQAEQYEEGTAVLKGSMQGNVVPTSNFRPGELSATNDLSGKVTNRERPETSPDTRLVMFVRDWRFDAVATVMIFLNSMLIAFETQWMTSHTQEPLAVEVLNHICSFYFIVELLLRLFAYRWTFFVGPGKGWNFFDGSLVILGLLDLIIGFLTSEEKSSTMDGFAAMKTMKMLRIVRVFRLFRFSRELSLMALMIVDSLRALMWALVMLSLMMFVFSICFTTTASSYLKTKVDTDAPHWHENLSASENDDVVNVHLYFGSLVATTYSLLRAMLGGINWGIVCDVLLKVDILSTMLFLFYVLFSVLAVLNIVTGVFVDNAVAAAKTQREFLIEKEREVKEKYVKELQDLFADMDKDGSGLLTTLEMQSLVADPKMAAYFSALGFQAHDCLRLFGLLDTDGSGSVDMEEFLEGCLRLKGFARAIDVHFISVQLNRMQRQVLDSDLTVEAEAAAAAAHRGGRRSTRASTASIG